MGDRPVLINVTVSTIHSVTFMPKRMKHLIQHLRSSLVILSAGALWIGGLDLPRLASPALAAPAQVEATKQGRRRVVVLDFDYAATSDVNYYWSYWRRGNASGISDLIVDALVDRGDYIVVDNSMVGGRQGFVTDVSTAVAIGRELGVDYVIMGSVTEFNVSTDRSGGGFLGVGVGQRETTANVALTARMISTADGAIVDTMRGRGSVGDRSSSVSIFGIGGGSSSDRENELMSQAVEQAITTLMEDLGR